MSGLFLNKVVGLRQTFENYAMSRMFSRAFFKNVHNNYSVEHLRLAHLVETVLAV